MTKVIFLQDILYEYLGIMYISAYLKKNGHSCDVLIEKGENGFIEKAINSNPDIIAFSVLSGSYKWAISVAREIKKRTKIPIVFGGVHVFLNPARTISEKCIDIICTGEGEVPLLELCDLIKSGGDISTIKGLWHKQADGTVIKNPPSKLIEDLDSIPFADRSIYWKYPAIAQRDTLPVLGSRGCPYDCTYCFIPSAKMVFKDQGKFIRERSPENILAEIEHCHATLNTKTNIHFVEDHFGNNRQKSLKVLQGLSGMKGGIFTWVGAIRIERFNKESYVKDLSETNHGILGIAVECGDENYRRDILKRPVTNDEIQQAADLANKYGIKFTTLNMLGLPGETFEQSLMTLDFNIKLKPVYANCYVYQPYPGTILQQYSVEHKLIDADVIDNIGLSFYDRYWVNNKELNRIINLQRVFALIVQFPVLKKPLVYLARNNWRISVDLIFGIYYTWYLFHFYNLNLTQILSLVKVWISSKKVSKEHHPSHESIKQGEGQLFPNMAKK